MSWRVRLEGLEISEDTLSLLGASRAVGVAGHPMTLLHPLHCPDCLTGILAAMFEASGDLWSEALPRAAAVGYVEALAAVEAI